MAIDQKVTVPAGTYYIGDPCYCFDEEWHSLLDKNEVFDIPMVTWKDGIVLGFRTQYGDGVYYDQYRRCYPVDAGLIGLVSLSAAEEAPPTSLHWPTIQITFSQPTTCTRYDDGVLQFGHIVIETGDVEEDDDYEGN